MKNQTKTGAAPLRRSTIFLHGSLGLPLAIYSYPLAIWLPAHYAGQLGISLSVIGTIIMLSRLTDVLTDPLMGQISDKGRTRWGRRKPYIMLGTPLLMIATWFLFAPAEGVGVPYLLIWLTLFFAAATMIQIPFRAWGAELSDDYHTRTNVTAAREFYVLAGLILAAAVPMVVEIMADGGQVAAIFSTMWADMTGAFTGEILNKTPSNRAALTGPVMYWLAITMIVLVPVLATLLVVFVKEPENTAARDAIPFVQGLRSLWRNGPMRRVLIIAFLIIAGESLRNAVSLFFIRDVIGIPTIGAAYFLYFISGICAIPFWMWLGKRIGKHRAFLGTLGFVSIVSASNLFLGYGDYFPFFCLFLLKGAAYGGLQFLPLAMLADVVDIDSARTGGKRAGTYFAVLGLSEKLAVAFFTGIALNLVGILGYHAGGLESSTDSGVLALRLIYCLGPIALYSLAVPLIWSYPLTPERHERLRQMLARREARELGQSAAGE